MNKDEAPTSPKDAALTLALEALENNKQTHYYCEDTWYSCPQHEDGCANDSVGDECNCGADKANAEIDKAIAAIKEALAQPEQKPVVFCMHWEDRWGCNHYVDPKEPHPANAKPLYTAPPAAAEREACAKVCETALRNLGTEYYASLASQAIRARGQA